MPTWPKFGSAASTEGTTPPPLRSVTDPLTIYRGTGRPDVLAQSHSRPDHATRNGAIPAQQPPQMPTTTRTQESSSPPKARQHGRALSNTLPFFRSRKDSFPQGTQRTGPVEAEEVVSPRKTNGTRRHDEGDTVTGRCATCGSKVTWPRGANEFRCVSCLMVNDLKIRPPKSSRMGEDLAWKYYSVGYAAAMANTTGTREDIAMTQRADTTISLDETRTIIRGCTLAYLRSFKTPATSTMPGQAHAARGHPPGPGNPFRPRPPLTSVAPQGHPAQQGPPPNVARSPPARSPFPPQDSRNSPLARPLINGRQPSSQTSIPNGATAATSASPMPHRKPAPGPVQLPLRSTSVGVPGAPLPSPQAQLSPRSPRDEEEDMQFYDAGQDETPAKAIFKQLEDYIIHTYGAWENLNYAFPSGRPKLRAAKSDNKENVGTAPSKAAVTNASLGDAPLPEIDAKTLLLGNLGENALLWTGDEDPVQVKKDQQTTPPTRQELVLVNSRSPRIAWDEVNTWYRMVLEVGMDWEQLLPQQDKHIAAYRQEINRAFATARYHVQRVLLKAAESLLRRPGRPLKEPGDARFLLILLANPLLFPTVVSPIAARIAEAAQAQRKDEDQRRNDVPSSPTKRRPVGMWEQGYSFGVVKRIFGILSNLSNESHRYMLAWFSRYGEQQFRELIGLIQAFVNHRLERQHSRKRSQPLLDDSSMIPGLLETSSGTSAVLHSALGLKPQTKSIENDAKLPAYVNDWQIKAAARIMSVLFAANKAFLGERTSPFDAQDLDANAISRHNVKHHGQLLSTSDFYNSLVDRADMIVDFDVWESARDKFAFCQYPFFLSVAAKIKIMEHDAKRQMEIKEREAFFNSILRNKVMERYLLLKVRRDCLVEDSLKGVSEVVGAGQEEIKKGLRVQFEGEEGVDAGGLRKEWFLLLAREIFDPLYGLFVYDDESHFCYFSPQTFETSDQYFLVGALLGLAIYNSTILDVALPPFLFKKLLAAGPTGPNQSQAAASKTSLQYTLEDLEELRPSLARGLRRLLEYDGNVEDLGLDFVAEVDFYDTKQQVLLSSDRKNKPVTNDNRQEFVNNYVRYLLDTQVMRQFEPFKRGFFTVCGGNALSLFQPEEIELLVRGSDEKLDVQALKAVAEYDNWRRGTVTVADPLKEVNLVQWFWEFFEEADTASQRRILSFITGSDRIPAMGAASLVIKISYAGRDFSRFPIARTCFNLLMLYKYRSKEELAEKVWRAVTESEGFGLK